MITQSDAVDDGPLPESWFCVPCGRVQITEIVDGAEVCVACKTPVERHLA